MPVPTSSVRTLVTRAQAPRSTASVLILITPSAWVSPKCLNRNGATPCLAMWEGGALIAQAAILYPHHAVGLLGERVVMRDDDEGLLHLITKAEEELVELIAILGV